MRDLLAKLQPQLVVCRMGNKAKSTISDRINRSDHQLKSSEILTSKGLRTVRLINEDLIVEWLPKDNPD